MGSIWIRYILPAFSDRLHIIGLVDFRENILHQQAEILGIPQASRFASMDAAFRAIANRQISAEICIVVLPPSTHRAAVLGAADLGLDILCEKPIADTWESTVQLYREVRRRDIRMQVVQNYRFTAQALAFRTLLREGTYGELNYLIARFAADYRRWGSWGAEFRHEITHPLLLEAAVHHFDQLRNFAGADFDWISGQDWRPPFAATGFRGECCALFLGAMTNGVKVMYEGSAVTAGPNHDWEHEIYRAECEGGVYVLRSDGRIVRRTATTVETFSPADILGAHPSWTRHQAIVSQFLDWLDYGTKPETHLEDNLRTCAAVFAAIEAAETGRRISVTQRISEAVA